ncbi:MAG: SprT family zinc-dependent metalloprotease [Glaciecola sp.]
MPNATLPTALINAATDNLQALFDDAKAQLQRAHGKWACRRIVCPKLLFTQRGKIAGSALLQSAVIKLNPKLYRDNQAYYLSQVIAHELAHILVFQLFGAKVKPHGTEWQYVMNDVFNLPANVTHQLDVSKVAMRTFDYACDCQHIQMTLIRHNKVLNNKQQYLCKKCRQMFTWQTNTDQKD